jgi:GNAT superfamily N-acetyltransferase
LFYILAQGGMMPLFTIGNRTARLLRPNDTASMQTLLDHCTDYFELVEGEPPAPDAARQMFEDVAPGKTLDDKRLIGVFAPDDMLIGLIDVMRGYPEPAIWFIGLMLIDAACQGQGTGAAVYHAFEQWASGQGARGIGLGVVEANERAHQFWVRMGFSELRRTPPRRYGQRDQIVIVMQKPT